MIEWIMVNGRPQLAGPGSRPDMAHTYYVVHLLALFNQSINASNVLYEYRDLQSIAKTLSLEHGFFRRDLRLTPPVQAILV